MTERALSSAETAKRLGVTAKALRLYEQRGLVAPMRDRAGWRSFGPSQLARLHQIVALKKLGLTLTDIATLLEGEADKLNAVLALQERALTKECQNILLALTLVRTARQKLTHGSLLSIDDLASLALETTPLTPLWEKHFTRAEMDDVANRRDLDDAYMTGWATLFKEIESLARAGDPHSPEALDLGRRWLAQSERFIGGDKAFGEKLKAFGLEAMSYAETRISPPFTPETYEFLVRILDHLKSTA